jgi:hypothetical protein
LKILRELRRSLEKVLFLQSRLDLMGFNYMELMDILLMSFCVHRQIKEVIVMEVVYRIELDFA